MSKRETLTEEEHLKLVEIGNSFWRLFSALAEEYIAMMPPELEDITSAYLQDLTSIYGRKI